ncbi:hypothetical protein [Cedratvirus kamchatka]|uniref:Uncharacterized protein n=1 Tax=Cedratvirus kamchatka TaxID=2716914 RepID=A0A6G8MX89_9VIRU|nr:hypothetical protein [Cedratvirus kamchatka]
MFLFGRFRLFDQSGDIFYSTDDVFSLTLHTYTTYRAITYAVVRREHNVFSYCGRFVPNKNSLLASPL